MSDTLNRLQAALRALMEWRSSPSTPPPPDVVSEITEALGEAIEELGGVIEWENEEVEFVQTYLLEKHGMAASRDEVAAVIEALESYEGRGIVFRPDFGNGDNGEE